MRIDSFTDPKPEETEPEEPGEGVDESTMIIAAVGEFVSAHIAELGDKLAAAILTARTRSPGHGDEVDAVLAYNRALQAIKDATEDELETKDENDDKE
jgi:hypothetical protein